MIIVSDTSPINNLAAINQLYLLHQLYETVLIPEAVYRELTDPSFPVAGATEVQTLDWIFSWLIHCTISSSCVPTTINGN